MATTNHLGAATSGEAEKPPRDASYESSNDIRPASTRDIEKGDPTDPASPTYDAETRKRRRSSVSVMAGRSDPFGDETEAEIKYRTMSWWHASMSKYPRGAF